MRPGSVESIRRDYRLRNELRAAETDSMKTQHVIIANKRYECTCIPTGGKGEDGVKKRFSANVWREGSWYVAQCLEVDVASQGKSEEEALTNLREALELHFEEPRATITPKVRQIEAEIGAA